MGGLSVIPSLLEPFSRIPEEARLHVRSAGGVDLATMALGGRLLAVIGDGAALRRAALERCHP